MSQDSRYYRLRVPERYEWALPVDDSDYEVFRTLADRTAGDSWRPIRMQLLTSDDRGRRQKRADMPWLGGHVLILRDEAVRVAGGILRPHGEVLPLICDEAELAMFSAPSIANALDEERSDIVRFPSSGGIMKLRKPVLRPQVIGSTQAFTLRETPRRGDLFLAEPLVEALRATGLTAGTEFAVINAA